MVVSCLSSRLPVGAPSSPPGRVCKGGRLCLATQEPAEPLVSSTCRVSASDAEKKALEARALSLSLNYSFVTPLTSMVITKPEGQEQSQVAEKPVENGGCGSRVLTQPSPQPLLNISTKTPPLPPTEAQEPQERHPISLMRLSEAKSPAPFPLPQVHCICVMLGLEGSKV